ncbi:hypothetical protein HQO38_18845 [Rhodococcus fascians]|nr:hypothetical protein [Rhodococcus fascians]MBY4140511.1 hypothetical protein [Rhodococcus fascians]MBY4219021.1 hypothetical protein [Rhodococcus fascians]MBY4221973.1 hypothetical protein [Rhodococcus fascians]MBY4233974.1 hypothetical protein [Rhodococcus fascians]
MDAARANDAFGGARSTDVTRTDQDTYVRGEMDIAGLGRRVRSRYNLFWQCSLHID